MRCSFNGEKKGKKEEEDEQFPKVTKHISCKSESKFSWVVSCMAKVELQFGVSYASFSFFFAEHIPYSPYARLRHCPYFSVSNRTLSVSCSTVWGVQDGRIYSVMHKSVQRLSSIGHEITCCPSPF